MKDTASAHYAGLSELRVGMFIHLEGGWLAHPFPLSSFKLGSSEQIATIRSLGVSRVRWSPDKSDPGAGPGSFGDLTHQRDAACGPTDPACGAPGQAVAAPKAAHDAASRRKRESLAAQREAVRHCERQFAEATQACRALTELVQAKPALAREQAEALAGAFVERMLGDGETCIRLLGAGAGDKASLHAVNVTVISLLMGKAFGLSEGDMLDLGVGAMLHDIGKLALPERVRHCEEHHSPAQVQYYQEHVAQGVLQARKMGLAPGAMLVIAQHHEHADGSGFPLQVTSDRMSIGSRIVSLVDRYDNLCNPHLPSRALTPHDALSQLFAQGKTKFDTTILGGFIRMMGVYPPGSAVQLTDDRYALVVSVNSSRPLKPRVLVHDPQLPHNEALLLDLEGEPRVGIRRSIKPQALPREALEALAPRPRTSYFFEPVAATDTVR